MMRNYRHVVYISILLILIAAVLLWVVSFGTQSGMAIQRSPPEELSGSLEGSTEFEDERGFVGVCNSERCATLPTTIEQNGRQWELGLYPDMYGPNEEVRLSYKAKHEEGIYMEISGLEEQ